MIARAPRARGAYPARTGPRYILGVVTRSAGVLLLLVFRFAWAQPSESPFLAVRPAVTDTLHFGRSLPAFEAKDIDGRTWTLEDLRGQFTLVYIWHTFEARAVDAHAGREQGTLKRIAGLPDLAEVQRFHNSLSGRKNLQVLTFCIDYDYTHAPAYMKEAKHTFPVIADWVLIGKLFGADARNARYLAVDPQGHVSDALRSWSLGRLLYELEAAAGR